MEMFKRLKAWVDYRRYIHHTKHIMRYLMVAGVQPDNALFEWYYGGFQTLIEISNVEYYKIKKPSKEGFNG
jgi:hypothetical protein